MKILFRNFPDLWRLDPAPYPSMTSDRLHDMTYHSDDVTYYSSSSGANVICSVASGTDMTCDMTSPNSHCTSNINMTSGMVTSDSYEHLNCDNYYHRSHYDLKCSRHYNQGCHPYNDSIQNSNHSKSVFNSSENQNHHFSNSYQYVNSGSEWFTFRDLAKVRFYCAVSFVVPSFSFCSL